MPQPDQFCNSDLIKQVRTPPVRPADGGVGLFYESFVPGEDCCELGLRAKIKSAEHAPAL
ncbi:hypothetical protein DXA34_16070 [[Clostridium] symbiosum]|nr:hypothetical protein DXA34_16070 [[Clostridium] symbiosum]